MFYNSIMVSLVLLPQRKQVADRPQTVLCSFISIYLIEETMYELVLMLNGFNNLSGLNKLCFEWTLLKAQARG